MKKAPKNNDAIRAARKTVPHHEISYEGFKMS
jgi:hypothetical protein